MATIGSINIGVRAETKDLKKDLDKNESALANFGKSLGGCGLAIAGFAAAAGAAALTGLVALTMSSMDSIDANADLAQQLGTSSEALGRLQHAANLTGSDAESLNGSLMKMNLNLDAAKGGTGPVADALKKMGLNAKELIDMDPAEAFRHIAGGIAQIENPAEQAGMAMDVFGKQGLGLLNTLKAEETDMDALAAAADQLGLTVTDIDASKIGEAKDALDNAWAVFVGLGNTLAVQISPVITAVVSKFTEWAASGQSTSSIVSKGLEIVAMSIGVVMDVVQFLGQGFKVLQTVVSQVVTWAIKAFANWAKSVETILNLIPGVSVSFGTALQDMSKEMDSLQEGAWKELQESLGAEPPSTGIKQFFDDIRKSSDTAADTVDSNSNKIAESMVKVAEGVQKLTEKLEEQVKTFGMSSTEAELFKLKQAGATAEMLKGAMAANEQLKALEANKKMKEENDKLEEKAMQDLIDKGKAVRDSLETPIEKYKKELTSLTELKDKGLLTGDQFDKAKLNAQKGLGGSSEKPTHAGAIELGSAEARTAILKHQAGGKEPIDLVAKNTETTAKALAIGSPLVNIFKGIQNGIENTVVVGF